MGVKFHRNPVIAHRGAFKKNGYPENSIASLKEATRLGCTGSEFDVRMTADDILVVQHDSDYHQMEIEKANYSTLAQMTLPNGETLPTLREYILAGMIDNNGTRLVVEIKPSEISKERGQIIAEKVVKMVEAIGASALVVYISFDFEMLKNIRKLNPHAITQYLEGDKSPEQLKAEGIDGADYHISVFRKNFDWIHSAKKHKLILNAWTVNDPEEMKWLLSNDFDFITTNEPEMLFEILQSLKPKN
ncbi:MAG: glycerophosphodiester phosphodiesterase [Flavisolibacter sp.]